MELASRWLHALAATCYLLLLPLGVRPLEEGDFEPTDEDSYIPKYYDKDMRPGFKSRSQDIAEFGLYIYKIGPVSETTMSMTTDIYFRQHWTDSRLAQMAERLLNESSYLPAENGGGNESVPMTHATSVTLKGSYLTNLWKPNIYFIDSITESTPSEISKSELMLISKGGEIVASKRVVLQTRCQISLKFFPLDKQTCPICFMSYEYSDPEQQIGWDPNLTVEKREPESTATFEIVPRLKFEEEVELWNNVNWTKLCVTVSMNRKLKIYIVTMFLPSIALVVLSWVSFWIDKKAVPARSGLTITTILAQITLITGTANQFPGVADLKLGDIYMIVNFFFVFGSLVEFAMVNNQAASREVKKLLREAKAKQQQQLSLAMKAASPSECSCSWGKVSQPTSPAHFQTSALCDSETLDLNTPECLEVEDKVYANKLEDTLKDFNNQGSLTQDILPSISASAIIEDYDNYRENEDDRKSKSMYMIRDPDFCNHSHLKLRQSGKLNNLSKTLSAKITTDSENYKLNSENCVQVELLRDNEHAKKTCTKSVLIRKDSRRKSVFRNFFQLIKSQEIDDISKVLFPTLFIIWSILFFIFGYNLSDISE